MGAVCGCNSKEYLMDDRPTVKVRNAPLPSLNPYTPLPPEQYPINFVEPENVVIATDVASIQSDIPNNEKTFPETDKPEEIKAVENTSNSTLIQNQSPNDNHEPVPTIPNMNDRAFSEISVRSANSDLSYKHRRVRVQFHPQYLSQQYNELIRIECEKLKLQLIGETDISLGYVGFHIFQDPLSELDQECEKLKKESDDPKVLVLFSSELYGRPKTREGIMDIFEKYEIKAVVLEKWKAQKGKKQSKNVQEIAHSIVEIIRKAFNVNRSSFNMSRSSFDNKL